MKLKNIPAILAPGLFAPKPRTYDHNVIEIDLGEFGVISYAKWNHPTWSIPPPDEAIVRGLKRILKDGDVAIDIGAHQGDTTVPMALACGPSGAVFAFEPNTHVYPVLTANSTLNTDRLRIIPFPYAAMQDDGEVTFWYSDGGFHNGGQYAGLSRLWHNHVVPLKVEGRRIIPLLKAEYGNLLDRLRFIKTDTEGADLDVLLSIEPLIGKCRPYIRLEVNRNNTAEYRARLKAFFAKHGYALNLYMQPDIFGPSLDDDDLVREGTFDIIATPPGPRQ